MTLPVPPSEHGASRASFGYPLVVLWSLLRLPPWSPGFVHDTAGVDLSWIAMLHEAIPRGWRFGSELQFTYGPLGFLHTRLYHPETYTLLTLALCGVAIVVATSLWLLFGRLVRGDSTRPFGALIGLELLCRDTAALCFGLPVLLFLLYSTDESRADTTPTRSVFSQATTFALLVVVSALPWVKFSYVPVVAGLTACLALLGGLRRRIPVEAGLLPLTSIALWFATGHDAAHLAGYLRAGRELSSGYSAAMGTSPDSATGWFALAAAAVLVFVQPVWIARRLATGRWKRWLTGLFFVGVLFIAWKATFVRWHPAKLSTFLNLTLFIGLVGWRAVPTSVFANRLQRLLPTLHAVGLTAMGLAVLACQLDSGRSLIATATNPVRAGIAGLARTSQQPGWLRRQHAAGRTEIRTANPIPPMTGTVDVFPAHLVTGLAHDLDLRPRPVLQSYAAFTEPLLAANRLHYRSAGAPEHVLMSHASIDGRLATMEDGPTWLELLRRYEPVQVVGETLHLRRRSEERSWRRERLVERRLRWGETWELEADVATELDSRPGWLFCEIDCRPNVFGKLGSVLYRLPTVRLTVSESSKTRSFRIVPNCARAGFVIDPLVTSSDDFADLWAPRTTSDGGNRVASLRLSTECVDAFEDSIRVTLWRIDLGGSSGD